MIQFSGTELILLIPLIFLLSISLTIFPEIASYISTLGRTEWKLLKWMKKDDWGAGESREGKEVVQTN